MAIQAPTTPARAGERGRLRKPQPGPVTLAIRAMRPNEAPSWEMRQRQIDGERQALLDLRQRIADQIEADQARIERCVNALYPVNGNVVACAEQSPTLGWGTFA